MSCQLSFSETEMGIFFVVFLPDVQNPRGGRGPARSLYDELVAVSRPREGWAATPLAPASSARALLPVRGCRRPARPQTLRGNEGPSGRGALLWRWCRAASAP
jgi:hypothetical protein